MSVCRLLLLAVLVFVSPIRAADEAPGMKFASFEASKTEYDRTVAPFLAKHCTACHNDKKAEGDLNFVKLAPDMKTSPSAARWVVVLEKLATRAMPPESRPRPDDDSVRAVARWVHAEMKRANKHAAKRETYSNGNSVDHAQLFDPKQPAPYSSAPQARRISPELYAGLIADFSKDLTVGQPFTPDGKTTFKDMGAVKIDEPVADQLLRNALTVVNRQLTGGPGRKGAKEFAPLVDPKTPPTDSQIAEAIAYQFVTVLKRKPTAEEAKRYAAFFRKAIIEAGPTGAKYALASVLLLPEAVFRLEVGDGKPDADGRVRLAPRTIAFAIAFALTDKRPDGELLSAAEKGQLNTDAGVAKQVRRLLDSEKIQTPRVLRFFREYFGYESAAEVFKTQKEFPAHDPRTLIADADRLIEAILEADKDVLKELLTTDKGYVAYRIAADSRKKRAEALAKYEADKAKNPAKFKGKEPRLPGRSIYESYSLTEFPATQPVTFPAHQRAGILTHPAWLVAHSTSDDNHAIHRGKWVRERLLGGVVPDIPITVDAQLPLAPEKTLRERMAVTQQAYCWKCHQLMNDVGLPFEMYDHFGRYRETEPVQDPVATKKNVDKKGKPLGPVLTGKPVNAAGKVAHTGVPAIEGDVTSAVELVRKLAASPHVEQVFVRHAFRYWMGRNETLGDAKTVQAAHKAYRDSGGSMKSLIVSLLTSESFLYRVPPQN